MRYTKPTQTLNINGLLAHFNRPWVMGILNLTPDSFYDGGKYVDINKALTRADQMIAEGADILDIGAYSSRPGAKEISAQEEIDRLIPTLEKIHKNHPLLPISIDTFRSEVAYEGLKAGADMINDISAGELDPDMFDLVASHKVPYIMMHMRGTPQTMQSHTDYTDLVEDIALYFGKKINELHKLGVTDIVLDPGFGFSKTLQQNYELLDKIDEFHYFGLPILGGISRKSMIYKKLGIDPEQSLLGTTALNTLMLYKGVQIIRVHDVKEAKQLINLLS